MGQYLNGGKIGTCENMYYMRIDEAEKLANMGARDDDGISFAEYLIDGVTRFRFRFPDEDLLDHDVLVGKDFKKGFMVPAGGIEAGQLHGRLTHSTGGAGNVNIFIPCPYSNEFKQSGLAHSPIGEQRFVVLFEAYREKKLRTIFACQLCDEMFWLPEEAVAQLKARAREYYEAYNTIGKNPEYKGDQELYKYAMQVIDRIQ